MTAYVVTAHLQRTHIEDTGDARDLESCLRLDTMVLGYGEWLGDAMNVLFRCIDLDGDLSGDALVVEEESW